MSDLPNCHDCGVKPGEFHEPGCDIERCPWCGGQMLSCGCYTDHQAWIDEHLIPWTGIWPGEEAAKKLGFWCYWGPDHGESGWVTCEPDHPDARPHLNRLYTECRWDRDKQEFVLRTEKEEQHVRE
jgi:hypothetical protein